MRIEGDFVKLLILSDATWSDDNNIGNTFTNLFKGWPKEKIAMVYARPDLPKTIACDSFFQISEKRLIRGLVSKKIKTGIKIDTSQIKINNNEVDIEKDEQSGKKMYGFFLKYRWNIFLIAREILWKIGRWKTKELDEFIEEYNPDIILSLACSSIYMNNLQQYVIKHAKSKSIVYFVDDVYSLKQLSFSPLFWISKLLIRRSTRKTVELADRVYTIVPKQKEEYDRSLKIDSKLLSKGGVFEKAPNTKVKGEHPYKLVYTGNIYAGRWETLEKIGRALDKINVASEKGILYIYSRNNLTSKMKVALSEIKSIKYMGAIPAIHVNEVQKDADILVHVESMRLKEKLLTRLSFSTKLVDYFATGKCILAVGWNRAASIEYLKKNKLAAVIDDLDEVDIKLNYLLNNSEALKEYAQQSWNFGKNNHEIKDIRSQLINDFIAICTENVK